MRYHNHLHLGIPEEVVKNGKKESTLSKDIVVPSFTIDEEYQPVPTSPQPNLVASLEAAAEDVVIIRGTIDEEQEQALKDNPLVIAVWTDSRIEPFNSTNGTPRVHDISLSPEAATSPCSPYDCDSNVPKGTLNDVAKYLGADKIWDAGYRGKSIVIGICDSGVRRSDVPAVIGGWSPPGGTPPGDDGAYFHGTMCATDALGVCPKAKIFDIGILKSQGGIAGLLSDAIAAYDWALSQFRANKQPQILSNSWGIYQENWSPDYARDPNHPFTRKVVEVIKAGILVCFAAGNCGQVCPSGNCGSDTGPGKSIWGANGHPDVITVGAANIKEQWIGYSSQGPASLHKKKPDVCGLSHFTGYLNSDNGTSAACPVVSGVLGLLKDKNPDLTQSKAKWYLENTAKDICVKGWDPQSGHGIVQAKAAYEEMTGEDLDGNNGGICFIATAAYGSPYAPQVQSLRDIRDKKLSLSLLGRTAVDKFETVYYTFSPTVARAMDQNPRLCSFIRRTIMEPIVVGLKFVFDR
ncbi:MAG: S8 family peptidase [Candidatus Thorarchaeota archaeon]